MVDLIYYISNDNIMILGIDLYIEFNVIDVVYLWLIEIVYN